METCEIPTDVKAELIKQLKNEIINSEEFRNAKEIAIHKAKKTANDRINKEVNKKVREIQNMDITAFRLVPIRGQKKGEQIE